MILWKGSEASRPQRRDPIALARWGPVQGRALAFLLALLSVSAFADEQPRQGGGMTIAFKDDLSTLDPAIGYDFQDWAVIRSIFSGLMDYVPGTTTLRPMLAQSYSLSADGLTYSFALRPGVVFSNGRALVASDIVYSLTRALDPRTASPGAPFLAAIDGVDAFVHGRSKAVAGLSAPDPATVVIRLAHPSAAFLQALALNFAFAVPREEVEQAGADFGRHPVGTGPFMLAEWRPGEAVTLVRNPRYFEPGIPHLDRVTIRVGEEPLTAVLQIEQGSVDALGNDIPPARFNQILHDPAWNGLVARAPKLETVYLAMKTNQKPFDDLRVRRAVAGAIDKARLAKLLNGRYVVADQVLPVGMPGYDPGYTGIAYDPAAARALLAQAGYPNGFSTILYSNNTDPNPRLAQAIQQDLEAVGIHAELRALALQTFNAAAGSPSDAPLVWSGVEGWSEGLSGPVRLLHADPVLRQRQARRLELVVPLRPEAGRVGRGGGRDLRAGEASRATGGLARGVRRRDGRAALGAAARRAFQHTAQPPAGRAGGPDGRPDLHADQLRACLGDGREVNGREARPGALPLDPIKGEAFKIHS